jgi:hypothetical protein
MIKQLECNGKTQSIGKWAKETGIIRTSIYTRLRDGWSIQEALTTPNDRYAMPNQHHTDYANTLWNSIKIQQPQSIKLTNDGTLGGN